MAVTTRLVDKHKSPLLIKRYYLDNKLVIIGVICDKGLIDFEDKIDVDNVGEIAAFISDSLVSQYEELYPGMLEGLAVLVYDIETGEISSSLYGDFMNHGMCRDEFYYIANILIRDTDLVGNFKLTMRKYNILKGWPIWIISTVTEFDDEAIVKSMTKVENDYKSVHQALEQLKLPEHSAIFAYVDKAWIVHNRGLTRDLLDIALKLLIVSPHV